MPIYDLLDPNKYVDKATRNERLSICKECPLRIKKYGTSFTKMSCCPVCKCILSLKTKLNTEKCPLGDWF